MSLKRQFFHILGIFDVSIYIACFVFFWLLLQRSLLFLCIRKGYESSCIIVIPRTFDSKSYRSALKATATALRRFDEGHKVNFLFALYGPKLIIMEPFPFIFEEDPEEEFVSEDEEVNPWMGLPWRWYWRMCIRRCTKSRQVTTKVELGSRSSCIAGCDFLGNGWVGGVQAELPRLQWRCWTLDMSIDEDWEGELIECD